MFAQRLLTGVVVALTVMCVVSAEATIISPLELTEYNRDVIYGPDGGQGGGFAQTVYWDEGGSKPAFFSAGTVDKGNLTQNDGLPIGDFTSLANANNEYCLAAAGGDSASNNVLWLTSGGNGTLTLASPGRFSKIGVLATTSSGGSDALSLVLNYADDSHSSGLTYAASDWYSTSTPSNGACSYARAQYVSAESGGLDDLQVDAVHGKNFWLYETVVEADPSKTLNSITFTGANDESYTRTIVFAVSGQVPEPSTVVLLATALLGLLAYAWRKRK